MPRTMINNPSIESYVHRRSDAFMNPTESSQIKADPTYQPPEATKTAGSKSTVKYAQTKGHHLDHPSIKSIQPQFALVAMNQAPSLVCPPTRTQVFELIETATQFHRRRLHRRCNHLRLHRHYRYLHRRLGVAVALLAATPASIVAISTL